MNMFLGTYPYAHPNHLSPRIVEVKVEGVGRFGSIAVESGIKARKRGRLEHLSNCFELHICVFLKL